LFGPVPRDHQLACSEVFGPVLSAMPFTDEEDAVRLANATEFGLLAGIWTRDGGRQTRMAKKMQCGQVYLNCYGAGGGVELPFGAIKKAGMGARKVSLPWKSSVLSRPWCNTMGNKYLNATRIDRFSTILIID